MVRTEPGSAHEARDAAQQIFEGTVEEWRGDPKDRTVFVRAVLLRWPWLRPNPYQPNRAKVTTEP